MSREIDPDKIASGDLDEDEIRYLQDRNKLPLDFEGTKVSSDLSEPKPLADQVNTGDANTKQLLSTPDQGGKEPEVDEEEEDEEDYEEGWNNDARRAELSKRGLSVEGQKADLIARLIEDDKANESTDGDDGEEEPTE